MSNGTVTNVVVISNDDECRAILEDAGLLDQVVRHPPFDTTSLIFGWNGHTALCIYSEGFEEAKDNGYEIFLIPSSCERADAIQFLAAIVDGNTRPGTPRIDIPIRNVLEVA